MNATAEIKRSVDQAVDVLLKDSPFDKDQVNVLRAMGFENTENVRDFEDHKTNQSFARHYAHRYPGFKFITHHQLQKITEKHSLKGGRLSTFKGAIPDKNVNDLMAFVIIEEDLETTDRFRSMADELRDAILAWPMSTSGISVGGGTGRGRSNGSILSQMYFDEARNMDLDPRTKTIIQEPSPNRSHNLPEYGAPSWMRDFERSAEKMHRTSRPEDTRLSFTDIAKKHPQCLRITAEPALFIAPDPDLDPIITVAVKGGYLIATAWGAEANDPDVTNAKMN